MVTNTQIASDIEPTAEFDAECLELIEGWQKGEIPTIDVTARLKTLTHKAQASGHTANQGRAEHLQSYIQHFLGNLNVSIRHLIKARQLFSRVENRRRIATMDLNLGENYRFKGEFKRARQLYRRAYEAATELSDLPLQTMAIANEGLVLLSRKEYEKARQALEEGLTLTGEWPEHEHDYYALRCEILQGLASVELAEGNYNAAWEYAQYALENANYGEEMLHMGYAYRILGDVLTMLSVTPSDSEHESPDSYYRIAQQAFSEIDAHAESARTMFNHARSLGERKRCRKAAKLFREAMVQFTRLGMNDDVLKTAEAQLSVL